MELNSQAVMCLAAAASHENRLFLSRRWLLEALTVTSDVDLHITSAETSVLIGAGNIKKAQSDNTPLDKLDGRVAIHDASKTKGILIKDNKSPTYMFVGLTGLDKPLFSFRDVFDMMHPDMRAKFPDLVFEGGSRTTVGRLIENVVCLQYPFVQPGGKSIFPFKNSVLKPQDVVDYVTKVRINKKIPIKQYQVFLDNLFWLNHITEISVPSMTERSLMTSPNIPAIKKKFEEEHQGQMHDPIVIKQLEDLCTAEDAKWLGIGTDNPDPSTVFFDGLGKKSYNLHRKKLFLTTGGIPAFDASTGKYDYIPNSLSEGWTKEAIPSLANEIRKGSYERGRETAKGGAETKLVMRVFQDLSIVKDDCGTRKTIEVDFKKTCRIKDFIGRTVQTISGDVEITEENKDKFDGTVCRVYSPMTCEEKNNLCHKCCGQLSKATNTKAIGIQVVKITSKFMNTAMKNMHGTTLQILQPSLEDILL